MSKFDVATWLQNVGMGQYADSFIENDIDGAVLSRLTKDDLKDDLHIPSLGVRMNLISLIAQFPQVAPVAFAAAAAAAVPTNIPLTIIPVAMATRS